MRRKLLSYLCNDLKKTRRSCLDIFHEDLLNLGSYEFENRLRFIEYNYKKDRDKNLKSLNSFLHPVEIV